MSQETSIKHLLEDPIEDVTTFYNNGQVSNTSSGSWLERNLIIKWEGFSLRALLHEYPDFMTAKITNSNTKCYLPHVMRPMYGEDSVVAWVSAIITRISITYNNVLPTGKGTTAITLRRIRSPATLAISNRISKACEDTYKMAHTVKTHSSVLTGRKTTLQQ